MFWQKELETLDRKDLRKQQLTDLSKTFELAKKSEFYEKKIPQTIPKSVNDFRYLEEIPFTEKQDLRNHFPYGMLAADLSDCVRLHSSSGTTGIPTVVFYTEQDLESWANVVARGMYMCGVRKYDIFQNMMGYGLFTGGLGFHYGAEKIGTLVIPSGPGNSKRQIWFLQTFQTTIMHILPSYALKLHTYFSEIDVDPVKDLKLKLAFIGAEAHSEEIRQKIEALYNIKAYNSYGLSEITGPGVAFECECQKGMHIWEDYFYMETIDPKTLKVLPAGEEGELVITTLKKEAMPLLRYRTRDLTRIIEEPCSCGRTHRRIERIKGRSDDMLIINGVNIFPIQIEKSLMKIPEIGNHYIIEIHKDNYMDHLTVKVEVSDDFFLGSLAELENLKSKILDELKSEIVVTPSIKLVEPSSLPENEGKVKRVYDYR